MLTLKIGNISDNNLSFDVKNLGRKRAKPKAEESNKKQNSKEINKRKTIEEISERKNWFFEKINKTDKLLVRLTKKKKKVRRHRLIILGLKQVLTPHPTDIKRIIIRENYEPVYIHKIDNLD